MSCYHDWILVSERDLGKNLMALSFECRKCRATHQGISKPAPTFSNLIPAAVQYYPPDIVFKL